jgi:DNA-binding response OmpR family regulator
MKKKILLVEDDLILGETIAELLEAESYVVVWVKDGQMAIDETFVAKFDLFLFDVNIPFINGFELLRQLREGGDITPAIFITANVDINSLKKGFDVGADDYIKKPFDCDELLIRIKAILKKSFKSYDSKIKYNDLVYDTDTQRLLKNNKYIHLTPSETSLLEYLLKNLDKIVTKDELIEQIHDDFEGSVEALRVWISKLKKLGFNITNIRGIGYRCEKV